MGSSVDSSRPCRDCTLLEGPANHDPTTLSLSHWTTVPPPMAPPVMNLVGWVAAPVLVVLGACLVLDVLLRRPQKP